MQECLGDNGEPVERSNKFGDPQEPKNKWLQSLQKQCQTWRVKVKISNFVRLGQGKRPIESAGGLGGIVASVHT